MYFFLLYVLVDQRSNFTKTVRFLYGYDVWSSTISLFYFTRFLFVSI